MMVKLPNCVKDNFVSQKIPSWVADMVGLDSGSHFEDLPKEILVGSFNNYNHFNGSINNIYSRLTYCSIYL